MARNNLSIILISLDTSFESMCFNQKLPFLWANLILNTLVGYLRETQQCPFSGRRCTRCCNSSHEVFLLPLHYCIWVVKFPREGHKIRKIYLSIYFSLKNIFLAAHFGTYRRIRHLTTSIFKALYFSKWCPIFDDSPLHQFPKYNNFPLKYVLIFSQKPV